MNENYTREIDLIDLFIDWLSHWKSLLVFILIGLILAGGYMYMGRTVVDPSTVQTIAANQLSGIDLNTLNEAQLATLSLEEIEKEFLEEKDIKTVDELVDLNNEYLEAYAEYSDTKTSLDFETKVEALKNLADVKCNIGDRVSALTADQQVYYNAKMGYIPTKDSSQIQSEETENDGETQSTTITNTSSPRKATLIVILAFVLHVIIFACRYIFSNSIKHTDRLSEMTSIPEYTRMIDWAQVDSKKGIDKLVSKMRFAGIRKTSLTETLEINASATVEKLKNKSYNSVAIVGTNLLDERQMFSSQISKANSKLTIKSIDSITHSVNGADDIAGVEAAILAVKVGFTRYNDFLEELQSLKDRDVDVIGIAVFE